MPHSDRTMRLAGCFTHAQIARTHLGTAKEAFPDQRVSRCHDELGDLLLLLADELAHAIFEDEQTADEPKAKIEDPNTWPCAYCGERDGHLPTCVFSKKAEGGA